MPAKARKRPKPRAYHHGDLKAALVEEAAAIVREKGPEALTLRAVAKRAGVSQAAPYRHFADRRALVAAVAERGFARLQEAMLQRMKSVEPGGRLGLKQVALAYIRFGVENPAEYRVMFGPEVANAEGLPDLQQTGRGVLGFVAEGMRQLQQAGLVGPGDVQLMAATMGDAARTRDVDARRSDRRRGSRLDALVEEATRIMMFGMSAR